MTDLLPCPFCGSTNLRFVFAGSQGYIECNECGTEGPCDERAADPYCDDEAACDAWNRRAALTEPIAGPVRGDYREAWDMSSKDGSLCFASAILSRLVGMDAADEADVQWLAAYLQANSTPQPVPVPVSERPWEREGWCDEQGRCWMGRPLPDDPSRWDWSSGVTAGNATHCLPHDMPALPAMFAGLPLPNGEVEP